MNLYFRELNAYKKSLFFWSLGMVFLVASGMAKYGAYQQTGQSMTELISQFPKSILTIFGLSGFDLSKVIGFYGVLFVYIALMATVHAVLLGSDIIGKEERDKTSEFLFVKPISRNSILTAKLLAGLTNVIVLTMITLASSFYFVDYFSKGNPVNNKDISVMVAGILFLQLLFYSAGFWIAATSKKPKAAPSVATAFLLLTFILSFIINVDERLDSLKYLTPFKYFDAKNILETGRLDLPYVAIKVILIILFVVFSYVNYSKRDLNT